MFLPIGWFLFSCLAFGCGPDSTSKSPVPEPPAPLRVIVPADPISFLPRSGYPVELDRKIAVGLAEYLGRDLEWIVLDSYPEMVRTLRAGEADVIAGNLAVTEPRTAEVEFSLPYLNVDELLIVPSTTAASLETVADLVGCELAVKESSPFYDTLSELQERIDIRIQIVPEEMGAEQILDAVADGRFSGTLLDSHYWSAIAPFREELSAPFAVIEDRPVALALHPDSDDLRTRVNEYLIFHALTGEREEIYVDDLQGLKDRKRLRVLTRNNATTYFLHRGTQLGFEYELLERFARKHDLFLEIVIPPSSAELIPWLLQGKGDVIAAALTITPERQKTIGFTRRYLSVDQVVVTRANQPEITSWEGLRGMTIAIRKTSAFHETLKALTDELDGVSILFTPETMETERILALVESGVLDATICDSHILEIEQTYGRELRAAFSVRETDLGWGVRPTNPALQTALDSYLNQEYRGLFYNMAHRRYFDEQKYIEMSRDDYRSDISGRISPYDQLAQVYAERHELDWRLLVALMFQESGFDPTAESWAGARGLTQVMPQTAAELGITDLDDPGESVRAGATYLRQMLNRFETDLKLENRIRFALASYNAGAGHVQDARLLARKQNWDPDLWFGNVERAMLLLQKPTYYEKARFGYCRGSETVRYVRRIEELYRRFVDHVPDRAELSEHDTIATSPK